MEKDFLSLSVCDVGHGVGTVARRLYVERGTVSTLETTKDPAFGPFR